METANEIVVGLGRAGVFAYITVITGFVVGAAAVRKANVTLAVAALAITQLGIVQAIMQVAFAVNK